jgi:hypothetical protein
MVPNISIEIVQQLKNLKPGNCIAFGNAFKIPVSMYIDLPNPRPMSNNVDISTVWYTDATPQLYAPTPVLMPESSGQLLGIYPSDAFIVGEASTEILNDKTDQRFVNYNSTGIVNN